jgi:hypothetical protein
MESIKLILILSVLCTFSYATFPRNISSPSPKRDTPSENPQRSLQENDKNKILLYFNQNCDYPSGFKNDYRKDISLIRQGYDTYEIDISKKISLKKDAEVEIHFANPIKTFEHFFDSTYDKNMEFVEFIDFTYFDSSEVENLKYLPVCELPNESHLIKGYFPIEDIQNYELGNYSAEDILCNMITPTIYAEKLKKEYMFGKNKYEEDIEGEKYKEPDASDYMYYVIEDYNSKEYEAELLRNVAYIFGDNLSEGESLVVIETEG